MWSVHQRLMTLSLTAQERKTLSPTNSRWLTAVAWPVKCWREGDRDRHTHTYAHGHTHACTYVRTHTCTRARAYGGSRGSKGGEQAPLHLCPPIILETQFAPLATFSVCNTDVYMFLVINPFIPPLPPPLLPPLLTLTREWSVVFHILILHPAVSSRSLSS